MERSSIWRDLVEPFTERQMELVKTFADQAVIAIENVRLFKEIQERNTELREALEHQTATSEVLSIISRSPTDVQPVLDAIVESAARVCSIDDMDLRLRDGNTMVPRAHFGSIPIGRIEISIDEPQNQWMREQAPSIFPTSVSRTISHLGRVSGSRTFLAVPLRQHGELIGTLATRRIEVRPFTPAQIKLLETFADQAVIAIENVRLFKNSRKPWSSRRQRVKYWVLLPARRRTSSRCWTPSRRMLCACVRSYDALIRLVEGDSGCRSLRHAR